LVETVLVHHYVSLRSLSVADLPLPFVNSTYVLCQCCVGDNNYTEVRGNIKGLMPTCSLHLHSFLLTSVNWLYEGCNSCTGFGSFCLLDIVLPRHIGSIIM
jgi:hypothetical protein